MIRLWAALIAALLCCGPATAQSAHDLLAGETRAINPRYLLQDPNGRSVTSEDFRGRFQLIDIAIPSGVLSTKAAAINTPSTKL